MNRNKKLTKTMAGLMTGVLLAQSGAGCICAEETAKAESSKEETVYVKTDAAGQKEEVIVSEWLKNPEGTDSLQDSSELENIENVKGEEGFTQNGQKIVWDADGKDIYYQGTTDRELPVGVEITYYLDGKEISPQELAGQSGHVKIRYQYKNLAKNGTVYTPFTMVTGMVLPGGNFKNVSIDNGKVISDGEKEIVIGIGMPGLADSLKLEETEALQDIKIPEGFELDADVTDFELTMAMTVATTLDMEELGLNEISGADDLRDALDDLTDASAQLVDGTGELADGVQTLKDSCVELLDGMNVVDENMGTLADGIETLNTKKTALIDGIHALADGIDTLENSKGALIQGVRDLDSGSRELQAGAKEAKSGSKTLSKSTKLLLNGVKELAQGKGSRQLQAGSGQLAEGSKALKDGSAALAGGISSMLAQANDRQMLEGAQNLEDGSAAFAGMLSSYTQGVNALLAGLTSSDKEDPSANGYMTSVNSYIDGVNQFLDGVEAGMTGKPAAQENTEEDAEPVVKTTISDQSVADIQAVLAELQGVQALLGSSSPEELLAMANQYPAYVAKLENCINLLNDSLGGIQQENMETVMAAEGAETPSQASSYAGAIGQLRVAGSALKAQSTASSDPSQATIQNAVEALSGTTKLNGVEMPVSTALTVSADSLASGASQLNGGVKAVFSGVQTQLLPGAQQLAEGASDLYTGAAQLDTGLGTLFAGANTIAENMGKLSDGASSLAKGNASLYSGAAALADGTGQLNSGAGILSSGISQLASGGSQLRNGAGELSSGIQELADGSVLLKDGTGQLADGGTKLDEGVADLKDGADELKNGMEKFNEEGIEKITEFLEGDVQDMLDRLEEIKDAEKNFKLLGDPSSNGNIKFIIETGSIEAE